VKVFNFSKIVVIVAVVSGLFGRAVPIKTAISAEEPGDLIKSGMVKSISGVQSDRAVGNFAEVEITLNDEITLLDISSLPRAPESDLKVLDDGRRVIVQLPEEYVEALVAQGVEISVLRKFILIEGIASQSADADGEIIPAAGCSGEFHYGQNPYNLYIEYSYPNWYGSGIDYSSAPATEEVTCIDVHYEVRNLSWSSIVNVELSDNDYPDSMYNLVPNWWGEDGDISQTKTGITAFNGTKVSQAWWLWATDYYADGYGYIDTWWLKLYYEEPPPEYCAASGGCSNYIEESLNIDSVEVGDISNTGTGCSNYADYTSMSTTMEIGTGYDITVINGDPYDENDQVGIWVDWNRDFDFYDAGEAIAVNGGPVVFTATITPPEGAAIGDTRMRIRIRWTGILSPCGTTDWGEVEDYTVTVAPESVLPGDFIEPDGVDMRDLGIMAEQWQQAPGEPSADIAPGSGDGIVDWYDLEVLVDNWLEGIE